MSTLRVDKITPFLSSSVLIEGNVIQANAATTGSNTFVGDQNIVGTITASIAEGFALVGGVGDISTLVATSSFGGGGGAGFPFSGSAVITGSLLVTGSTTIIGNLNITPALLPENPPAGFQRFLIPTLSGSTNTLAVDAGGSIYWTPTPNSLAISSSAGNSIISPNQMAISNGSFNSSALFATYIRNNPSAGKFIGISGDPSLTGFFGLNAITNPAILLQSGILDEFGDIQYYAPIQLQSSQSFSDGRVTVTTPLIGLQGAEITGSISVSGSSTFIGDQIVSGEVYLTGSTQLNLFAGAPGSEINFWSGSTKDPNAGVKMKTASGGLSINSIRNGSSFMEFSDRSATTPFIFLNTPTQMLGNNTFSVQSGSVRTNVSPFNITNIRANGTGSVYGSDSAIVRDNAQRVAIFGALAGFEANTPTQYINVTGDNAGYGNSGWAGAGIAVANADLSDYPVVIGFQSVNTYTDGRVTVLKTLDVSGSVNITQVLKLTGLDPLPANGVGQLAVSGSNLFYNDGATWTQIN